MPHPFTAVAVVAAEDKGVAFAAHQSVDDVVSLEIEEVYVAYRGFFPFAQGAQADGVGLSADEGQHADAAESHAHLLALFQAFTHRGPQEIAGGVG